MTSLGIVVRALMKERDQATKTVEQLEVALAALNGNSYRKRTRTQRKMSAGARARIAAAQRARWAKVRGNGARENVVSAPKKKTMSAAARKKVAAAQKMRWAKVRAAQKKSA